MIANKTLGAKVGVHVDGPKLRLHKQNLANGVDLDL